MPRTARDIFDNAYLGKLFQQVDEPLLTYGFVRSEFSTPKEIYVHLRDVESGQLYRYTIAQFLLMHEVDSTENSPLEAALE